jgi:26S proteasome regulatory subunit T5
MSTLEELGDLEPHDERDNEKQNDKDGQDGKNKKYGDAEMKDAEPQEDDILGEEILSLSTDEINIRKKLLDNDSRIMKSEYQRLSHEKATMGEKIKENNEKIENNR